MQRKNQKVSVSQTARLQKHFAIPPITVEFKVDGEIIPVEIKQYLPYADVVNFIENGVSMLFGEEDDTYIYQPYLYDFTFGYLILSYMTNFKTTGDNDDIWDLVIGSNLVDTIISHIPNKFIDMLKKGFDEAIEFKKTKIYSFERKMLFEMKEQIQEYIDTIQLFADRVPEVFGDDALEKLKELGNIEEPEVAMKVLESKVKKTGKNGKR